MGEGEKRKPVLLAILISVFAIIIGLGIYGYFTILSTDFIYEGVKINEFDLSYKTKEEALNLIKDRKERDIDEKTMLLTYEDKSYHINLRQLGFSYDYDDAIAEAYAVGRRGNIIVRVKDILRAKGSGVKISLNSSYGQNNIENIVDKIAKEINVEGREAEFNFNNGNINITQEVIGKEVDKEGLKKTISENIYALNPIEIPVNKTTPVRTKELLSRINGIIGEFSTSFKGSSSDRIENIRLASKSLSKKVIMPGETISFNETTGPREKKFGYKEANVIIAGDFTPGVGGGVCQASTTLYNALLLANVTIVERSPHSIPAKYVKFGQDAAVAYGYLDLKFRNDFNFPIYIHSKIIGDRIHIYVYGDKNAKDYTVKIESEIVETIPAKEEKIIDKSLAPGTKEVIQQGRTGYRVNTYKSIIKNGNVVKRDLITKDFYKPRNHIYRLSNSQIAPTPIPNSDSEVDEVETSIEAEEAIMDLMED